MAPHPRLIRCFAGICLCVTAFPVLATHSWLSLIGSTEDEAIRDSAINGASDVFVVGMTDGKLGSDENAGGSDAFLAKYHANGVRAWIVPFGTSGDDVATGVDLDNNGNPYVVGYTSGDLHGEENNGGDDIFIARFDGNGVHSWTKLLGTAADDQGSAITVDASNQVFVTGFVDGALSDETQLGGGDAFIARYDTSGNHIFHDQFGSTAFDWGHGINAQAGKVYIVGETSGDFDGNTYQGNRDGFMVLYTAAGAHTGTQMFATDQTDVAHDVGLDGSGNTFVVGYTNGVLHGVDENGTMFVSKHSGITGHFWTRIAGFTNFVASTAITTDAVGNSHIANGNELAITHLDTNGENFWRHELEFEDTVFNSGGQAIEVFSGTGNIFLGGSGEGTFGDQTDAGKSDAVLYMQEPDNQPPDNLVFDHQNGGRSTTEPDITLTLGATDNWNVAGYYISSDGTTPSLSQFTPIDLATSFLAEIEFTVSPSFGWKQLYGWFIDEVGNISTRQELLINHLDKFAPVAWTAQTGSTSVDSGRSVAVDRFGNCYVAGFRGGSILGGMENALLVKYSPLGQHLWSRSFGTFGSGQVFGTATAADSDGNVAMGGEALVEVVGDDTFFDGFVSVYDSQGESLWWASIDAGDQTRTFVNGVAMDASGDVYVAGYTDGSISGISNKGDNDIFVIKYDGSNGDILWTKMYGTASADVLRGTAVGEAGLYLIGYSGGDFGGQTNQGIRDILVIRASLDDGTIVWSRLRGGSDSDAGQAVAVDPSSGNVVFTAEGVDFIIGSLDPNGNLLWEQEYGGAESDRSFELDVDNDGNIYIAGESWSPNFDGSAGGGNVDVAISKIAADGERQFSFLYGNENFEKASGLGVSDNGNVCLAGSSNAAFFDNEHLGHDDVIVMRLDVGQIPEPFDPGEIFSDGFEATAIVR